MEIRKGFYPALGTPLDENGILLEESYRRQIELMISSGASGVLCMGSMGTEEALSMETYTKTAAVASDTVNGRIPLFIGAMDNSVYRVKERCESLKELNFDGVVLTTPFYDTTTEDNLIHYFIGVADISPKPVYLYDLPGVTKQKITYEMVAELAKHPNICGIKTADIILIRKIMRNIPDFTVLFSNLDIFDVGVSFGLPCFLDGMFTCTPVNSAKFVECVLNKDVIGAGKYLDNILELRDQFLENGIWPGYTIAMNLLGLEGNYTPGYIDLTPLKDEAEKVKEIMQKIGEI